MASGTFTGGLALDYPLPPCLPSESGPPRFLRDGQNLKEKAARPGFCGAAKTSKKKRPAPVFAGRAVVPSCGKDQKLAVSETTPTVFDMRFNVLMHSALFPQPKPLLMSVVLTLVPTSEASNASIFHL